MSLIIPNKSKSKLKDASDMGDDMFFENSSFGSSDQSVDLSDDSEKGVKFKQSEDKNSMMKRQRTVAEQEMDKVYDEEKNDDKDLIASDVIDPTSTILML